MKPSTTKKNTSAHVKKKSPINKKPFAKTQGDSRKPLLNKKRMAPKKALLDSAPKKEVIELFMAWFRKNKNIGQVMTKQDVVKNILLKIDAKQEDALAEAMNELKSEGFIEIQADGVTLVLTEFGFENL